MIIKTLGCDIMESQRTIEFHPSTFWTYPHNFIVQWAAFPPHDPRPLLLITSYIWLNGLVQWSKS